MKSQALPFLGESIFTPQFLSKLIIPLIIEQFLAVTIGMADTVMVASAGEAAVSAISLVDSISILIVQVFASFATGGAVVSSQYLGRKDNASANIAAKQLLILSLVVSVSLMAICLPFRGAIIRLIFGSIDAEVMVNSVTYFIFVLFSLPFLAVYNSCAALFRSMGNSKVSLAVSVLMNFINICGNAYFIFGLGLGVTGAGLATMLSRIIGALIMVVLISNRNNSIFIYKLWKFEWKGDMIKRILRIGVPNGIEGSVFQIGKLLVQGITASFGTASLAANAIANSVGSFANIPGNALGLASITVVGQCVGAQQTDQAVYYSKKFLVYAYFAMGLIVTPIFFFSSGIVQVFNLSVEATLMASHVIKTCMVASILIWPTAFTLPNFLRAAGDAKYTMIVSMFSMWVFRVGMSYLLALQLGFGLLGVWYAMYIDWIFRSICFIVRFARGKWKTKIVI
ncbi:putative efflux protein, MATE family [Sphaerochaeta pleomorpha str. Grapes]|uniref:Multidrug-efflux transporter n=1 Tax=Sphaerochaeta pleomorpha (strain ATCC BAA-1885 / DSM 22778 / Grapes) TaxID=158190 RepID=G8QXU3_SPHPG|nr:MATE family efflux transporter [Sphaerochaeta pleomorpha]AEV30737.1 putative efflux protein, MATE family [Sphaerochaeta pleomorpha str. Grapes]